MSQIGFPLGSIPFYGNRPPGGYKRQEDRGKLVNHVRAPAFAHSLQVAGDNVGGELWHEWYSEGKGALQEKLSTATPEDRQFIEDILSEQQRIQAIRLLSEQDVIKAFHAHVLRPVEELAGKLSLGLEPGWALCSLAEHTTTLVDTDKSFSARIGDSSSPYIVVQGKASIRPDNIFLILHDSEHDAFEPPKSQNPESVMTSAFMEAKGRSHVPVEICRDAIQNSRDDFEKFLSDQAAKAGVAEIELTPELMSKFERSQVRKFKHWRRTGGIGDEGGFWTGQPWLQQGSAYSLGHDTRFGFSIDYDGLVIMHFHHSRRHLPFNNWWNLGRGAGPCLQMSVYDWDDTAYYIPAIIGLLIKANAACFDEPVPDVPLSVPSDPGSSSSDEDLHAMNQRLERAMEQEMEALEGTRLWYD